MDVRTLSKRVKMLRKEQDISQAKLASMVGLTRQMISAIERGSATSIDSLIKIADALKTSVDCLLMESGAPIDEKVK